MLDLVHVTSVYDFAIILESFDTNRRMEKVVVVIVFFSDIYYNL